MGLNNLLVEECQIVAAIIPVDSQSGANNGDWVSMKGYDRCTVLVYKAAGVAGDDPVLTMKQATDVSGAGAKALNFTRVDAKVGAQTGVGTFTTVTQVAGNTYTDAVSAEAQGLFAIEFKAEDLDVNNSFDCIQVSVPDTGSAGAQILSALYLLRGARYSGPGILPSAIVDWGTSPADEDSDGGDGGYFAPGVAFAYGSALLITPLSGLVDTGKHTMSVWLAHTGAGDPINTDDHVIFSSRSGRLFYATAITLDGTNTSPIMAQFLDVDFDSLSWRSDDDVYPIVEWTHIAISSDVNHDDPDKILQIYRNGIPLSSFVFQDGPPARVVPMSLETKLLFGMNKDTGGGRASSSYSAADFQLWNDVQVDLSDPDNLAALISGGKPVDPAIAAARFGQQAVLLSGDADGFIVNQGYCGPVSSVLNLFSAPDPVITNTTSPSD